MTDLADAGFWLGEDVGAAAAALEYALPQPSVLHRVHG